MGHFYGTSGMWYKDGFFYELQDRHINFFLNHPEILGFSQQEKEDLCIKNGLEKDAVFCEEQSESRNNILLQVLKRGAIRIRFYGPQTTVQCGSKENPQNLAELKNCIKNGWGKCFGCFATVMDTAGWKLMISDTGMVESVKDFCGEQSERDYKYLKYEDL